MLAICFSLESTTSLLIEPCAECIGLTQVEGQTCLVAMESVSLHQLLSVKVLPWVTNR